MRPSQLFLEFRRRRVFRVAAVYAVVAWLVIQVATTIFPALEIPNWALRLVILLSLLGLPLALILAWAFELTPEGVRRTTAANPEVPTANGRRSALVYALVTALMLALGGAGAWVYFRSSVGAVSGEGISSVAVLPFLNMSSDPEQEFFSDGITEEILNSLAQVKGLRVPGRTTSFSFKGRNVPLQQVARELGVQHVLEGSVRKAGSRLRISAQLIDARTERHLWSQTYDRELADVFAIQEEIARSITQALQIRLMGSEQAVLVRQPTQDVEAYSLYLQGRHFWNRRGAENLRLAISHFQGAVARDPAFTRAHAGLAESYVLLPYFVDEDPSVAQRAAREAANTALALDPTTAPAHATLGELHVQLANWVEAEAAFRRALEQDPRDPTSRHWYCSYLRVMGRLEEALDQCNRAVTLDPAYLMASVHLGLVLLDLRRYAEATARLQHTVTLDPTFARARAVLAVAYALTGNAARAIQEAERSLALPTTTAFDLAWVGYAFAMAGRPERAREILARLETRPARATPRPVRQTTSLLYIGLGEHDRALDILEQEIATGDGGYRSAAFTSPVFDPIRGDPRFRALLRRLDSLP